MMKETSLPDSLRDPQSLVGQMPLMQSQRVHRFLSAFWPPKPIAGGLTEIIKLGTVTEYAHVCAMEDCVPFFLRNRASDM